LTRKDSELALRVACGVVTLVEDKGYRILDALVPQFDEAGRLVGVRDLVCEKRRRAAGLTSLKVKLRLLFSSKTTVKARRQIQTLSWKLWPAAKADSEHVWAERICLLLRWGQSNAMYVDDSWAQAYAEAVSIETEEDAPESWGVIWGWEKPLPSAEQKKEAARRKELAKVRAAAEAKAKLASKKKFDVPGVNAADRPRISQCARCRICCPKWSRKL
jgi:hypothetical protein